MNETTPGTLTDEERVRLLRYVRQTNFAPFVATLQAGRDEILARWLTSIQQQPWHLGRPARAVADHVPRLFDAVVKALAEMTPERLSLEDEGALEAATAHAKARIAQGLFPAEIVAEFRILREEILHLLREEFTEDEPIGDVLGAQLLLSATLDQAIGVAIGYFMDALERAKDDFVGVAAHDLRNPLTPLKGAAQLVKRQLSSPSPDIESIARNASIIERAVERVEQLINNLLDVTRVQTGRLEVHPAPMDLRATVERVVLRQSEEARERAVVEAPAGPIPGEWEESRVEQVVENLLSNALKYAPKGPIQIVIARGEDTVRLEVRDNGIGLSPDDQVQLFRRFYRSPQVIDQKIEGTGLGLFICRGIVEAHGGELEARSGGPDKGTTMIVTLPTRKAEPAS